MRRSLAAGDRVNQHLMADGHDAGLTSQVGLQRDHGSLADQVQGFPTKAMVKRPLPAVIQQVGVGGCDFIYRGPGVALVGEPLTQVELYLHRDI